MRRVNALCLAALLVGSSGRLDAAQVSILGARQVQGTKTFEISYRLTGELGERQYVTLGASAEGRDIVTEAVTGDVGEIVAGSAERKIVWDAGSDWDDNYSESLVFTVRGSNRGPYMVVDVTDIKAAKISYLAAEPADGWDDSFKTSKIVLKWVGPGSFVMAKNRHVTLTHGYYLGIFEITQQQWKNVMGKFYNSWFTEQREMRPVERVTFWEIWGGTWPEPIFVRDDSFIGVLRSATGCADFDLPTEAQWEYACRAGTTTDLYNGMALKYWNVRKIARCEYNSGALDNSSWQSQTSNPETTGTAIVGDAAHRNPWGFYDMLGNVWEVCRDWYQYFDEEGGEFADPVGPTRMESKPYFTQVLRGGGWASGPDACNCFWRWHDTEFERRSSSKYVPDRGFRLSCEEGDRTEVAGTSAAVVGDTRVRTPCTLSVVSDSPSVSPSVGQHAYGRWDVVRLSASDTPLDAMTKYACIGWVCDDGAVTTGFTSTCSLTLTNNTTFTWLWQTNQLVTVVDGAGTCNVKTGWYGMGETLTLSAVPPEGQQISHWLVNGKRQEGSGPNARFLSVSVSAGLVIEPVYCSLAELYAAHAGQGGGAQAYESGVLEIETGATPVMRLDGSVVKTGRIETGVAKFDFEGLTIGEGCSVVLRGDRPLVIASSSDLRIGARLLVTPGTLGGGSGGAGGVGGNGGAGGSGGSSVRGGAGGAGAASAVMGSTGCEGLYSMGGPGIPASSGRAGADSSGGYGVEESIRGGAGGTGGDAADAATLTSHLGGTGGGRRWRRMQRAFGRFWKFRCFRTGWWVRWQWHGRRLRS